MVQIRSDEHFSRGVNTALVNCRCEPCFLVEKSFGFSFVFAFTVH